MPNQSNNSSQADGKANSRQPRNKVPAHATQNPNSPKEMKTSKYEPLIVEENAMKITVPTRMSWVLQRLKGKEEPLPVGWKRKRIGLASGSDSDSAPETSNRSDSSSYSPLASMNSTPTRKRSKTNAEGSELGSDKASESGGDLNVQEENGTTDNVNRSKEKTTSNSVTDPQFLVDKEDMIKIQERMRHVQCQTPRVTRVRRPSAPKPNTSDTVTKEDFNEEDYIDLETGEIKSDIPKRNSENDQEATPDVSPEFKNSVIRDRRKAIRRLSLHPLPKTPSPIQSTIMYGLEYSAAFHKDCGRDGNSPRSIPSPFKPKGAVKYLATNRAANRQRWGVHSSTLFNRAQRIKKEAKREQEEYDSEEVDTPATSSTVEVLVGNNNDPESPQQIDLGEELEQIENMPLQKQDLQQVREDEELEEIGNMMEGC